MTPKEAYLKCYNENRIILELESIIALDSEWSYYYARNIIYGRWEEGEKSISTDSKHSYYYALDLIEGKWEKGEKAISTDPLYSYWYAHNVIKSHFDLCHPIIFNSHYKNEYIDFLKSINYDLSEIGEWLI